MAHHVGVRDAVFTLKPENLKQADCRGILSVNLAHMFKKVQEKTLSAIVVEIPRSVGVERKDVIRKGKRAGETYMAVTGVSCMSTVAAWNYGVKLYHGLISEDSMTDSSAAKRKADDDDEPVVVEPPAKKEKNSGT